MKHALIALLLVSGPAAAETFTADVWADNWFEMRIDGQTVAVDSVPITTERSFNAESFAFTAERPFTVGLIAMDFKENDTGLEYIGTRRQQMGDGGVIVQVRDSDGQIVTASDATWQCMVAHAAPADPSCAAESAPVAGQGACAFDTTQPPDGWDLPEFDATAWSTAQIYTPAQVDPKDGYDRVQWADSAQLIWGPDLERDNTVLCRVTVQ